MFWLAIVLLGLDFQNVLAWWPGRTLAPALVPSQDYAIVVPVYGARRYFEDRRGLTSFRERVVVSLNVSDPDLALFADELRDEGWRVVVSDLARPGPPALVREALPHITEAYIFRMDADTVPLEDPGLYVTAMLADGAELASVRVAADSTSRGACAKLQQVEYRMSMLSRRFRPWLTSGACFVGTHAAITHVLDRHTCWFPGEDLETGRIAKALSYRVRHLDFRVRTDAPQTWRGLYRQRQSWWAGGFRHAICNFDKNAVHMPIWTAYYGLLVFGGWGLKVLFHFQLAWVSVVAWTAALYLLYVAVTFVANWQVRSWWMFALPPYAFTQTLAMPVFGLFWYAVFARQQSSLGRYRFGYRREARLSAGPI